MKIIENQSLREICNQVNLGLIKDDIKDLIISSEKYPEFVVRILDVNITEYIYDLVRNSDLKDSIDQMETSFYDFVVFTIAKDEGTQKRTLCVNSLFELMLSYDTFTTMNDEGKIEEIDEVWNRDQKVWNLINIKIK